MHSFLADTTNVTTLTQADNHLDVHSEDILKQANEKENSGAKPNQMS